MPDEDLPPEDGAENAEERARNARGRAPTVEVASDVIEKVGDELATLLKGARDNNGQVDEEFLLQAKLGQRRAYAFLLGYRELHGIGSLITQAANRKDEDGNRICPGQQIPGRDVFEDISRRNPVSLLSLLRLHLVSKAVVENRSKPKLATAAKAIARVIGENGFGPNSIVVCLNLWNKEFAEGFRRRLAEQPGGKAMSDVNEFSKALVAGSPLENHAAAPYLVGYLETGLRSGEPNTGARIHPVRTVGAYRVSRDTADILHAGCERLARRFHIGPPTMEELFTIEASAGGLWNNGRSTVALRQDNGNLV